jgi:hypothetical protein
MFVSCFYADVGAGVIYVRESNIVLICNQLAVQHYVLHCRIYA